METYEKQKLREPLRRAMFRFCRWQELIVSNTYVIIYNFGGEDIINYWAHPKSGTFIGFDVQYGKIVALFENVVQQGGNNINIPCTKPGQSFGYPIVLNNFYVDRMNEKKRLLTHGNPSLKMELIQKYWSTYES